MNDIGGFMICKKASSSPHACENCRDRIEVSVYGKVRMQQMAETGKRMALLCNTCGATAMATMTEMAAASPKQQTTIEVLPVAIEQIADRDPELMKALFRRDSETRAQKAKDDEKP